MHSTDIRVIYGDTDRMGVVYYANYLRYFEAARNEYFRARGGRYRDMEQEGVMLPVIEAGVRYRAPARYDDLLRVDIAITEIRRVSLRFGYRVRRAEDSEVLAEGHTVHACVDREHRPVRLPDHVRSLLVEETL